jgi:hypothetical protein
LRKWTKTFFETIQTPSEGVTVLICADVNRGGTRMAQPQIIEGTNNEDRKVIFLPGLFNSRLAARPGD